MIIYKSNEFTTRLILASMLTPYPINQWRFFYLKEAQNSAPPKYFIDWSQIHFHDSKDQKNEKNSIKVYSCALTYSDK